MTFQLVQNDASDLVTDRFGPVVGLPIGCAATVDYIAVRLSAVVPEPTALLMFGAIGLLLRHRRRHPRA